LLTGGSLLWHCALQFLKSLQILKPFFISNVLINFDLKMSQITFSPTVLTPMSTLSNGTKRGCQNMDNRTKIEMVSPLSPNKVNLLKYIYQTAKS
jgi:hypothetical protein